MSVMATEPLEGPAEANGRAGWAGGRRSSHELTALERLLMEELPTGKVRDWNPGRPDITEAEAARHRADLEHAIYRTNRRRAA